MKSLRPTMKENKRYLLLRGVDLKKNFERAILEYVGVLGFSRASPSVIKSGKDWLVISINREVINDTRASFVLSKYKIKVEKVSGTLKGLKIK